ncbi:DUF2520 domain-containing protein [Microbacterium sp. B2969]|uniref:DUF2520 domain-containing protein n=1 Tax=Microbacterium alkaliflavum TaxID=3248839 RepID=A0ABW7Q581_9MICO
MPTASSPLRVSVVGAGRLGTALTRALRTAGVAVQGPTGRGTPVEDADIAVLCVPDAEIRDAAHAARPHARLVGHTSGATTLADANADFGLHPLGSFLGHEDLPQFQGLGCAIAGGTPEATNAAAWLAGTLGMTPFAIDDEARASYHAAASLASNYLVTLQSAAERLAGAAGLAPGDARTLFAPLVRGTVENWAANGPEAALTGPIARGDEQTVSRQRAAVAADAPELLDLFDVLADRTRVLAQHARALAEGTRALAGPAPALTARKETAS